MTEKPYTDEQLLKDQDHIRALSGVLDKTLMNYSVTNKDTIYNQLYVLGSCSFEMLSRVTRYLAARLSDETLEGLFKNEINNLFKQYKIKLKVEEDRVIKLLK